MRQYERTDMTSQNREKPRSYYIPYDTLEKALAGDRTKSAYYKLLNGVWDFAYFKSEYDIPEKITAWDKTDVPSCFQVKGYGVPVYSSHDYLFPVDPPYVPDDNPCGIYSTCFTIDEAWVKRQTYIVFEGVSSCLYLYINGNYVGFSEGSHFQAEFDISKYITEGENTLTAKVLEWCAGSYLECQDMFRLSGIFRDVYLLSREYGHIKDVYIKADTKSITVDAGGFDYDIYDGNRKITDLSSPILWNSENPHLYTVIVKGKTEYISFLVGMRDIRISDKGELLINGVPIKLRGVNHHDTHPYNGFCMTDDELKTDLLKMKELNINTIRTSHYPPTPEFLNMCDMLGFYVIEENDFETHGFCSRNGGYVFEADKEWPCADKNWQTELVERMMRMVERDKNHASIIMWSVGNECAMGENQVIMAKAAKKRDSSRLLHCQDQSVGGSDNEIWDVYGMMYPSFEQINEYLENEKNTLPYFMTEYAHAMGNGPGDVKDYMKAVLSHDNMIGGCIWEWADHTVIIDGIPKYGGDFPHPINNGNICCDGIVFYDRSYKAGSLCTKYAYQRFDAELCGGNITIKNLFDFTNLGEYTLRFELSADGNISDTLDMTLDIAPHSDKTIEIPFDIPKRCRLGVFINIFLTDKDGIERGMVQLECNVEKDKILPGIPSKIHEKDGYAYIGNYIFNMRRGCIEGIVKNRKNLLAAPVLPTVWRAPTDNERFVRELWETGKENKGENLNVLSHKVYDCAINGNTIIVHGSAAGISRKPIVKYEIRYTFFDGTGVGINISCDVKEEFKSYLPRFGFEFMLNGQNGGFEYYGMGPYESYCDMNCHTLTGYYKSSADKEYVNYIMPQEHGNHFNTRLLKTDNGITFSANGTFEFNVSSYTAQALTKATHINELKKNGCTNVRIDYRDSGIGSDSCAPDKLLPQYRLSEKHFDFEFFITV